SGYYHHLIFGPEHVVLNIGGIANLSASRYRAGVLEVRAFDVGPGNMFSDGLAQRLLHRPYDRNGGVAARGNVLKAITRAALARAYFERRPPKTCGREEFGATAMERLFFRSGRPRGSTADLLATAVEITAQSIARACERWLSRFTESRALVVTGGGAHNQALMRRLQELLPAWQLISPREWGIPDDFVEPVGFAVLGYEFACGRPGNLGGATGARPAILGLRALADG
ncbi:MAG TPA: anhydro-N-acetylmuramic acid kinase, partial [candidate division Zixibacteria bacterium]|nr:anhydro-N-acetylmuramic acid kinase [candidate division Zixibacteria bacterium]